MSASVAVVIPFYQRTPGLLRTAVESVARQEALGDTQVRIIVVDDASPMSPFEDLSDLSLPAGMQLAVIARPNGGAGAARNTGIEHAIALGCTTLAFLDSDDRWEPLHLATARAALRTAPFFFANSMHDDVTSFFYFRGMAGRTGDGVLGGSDAFALILEECVPHTSQVAYDLIRYPDVRFDETMRRTGEDHLFWLSIAARGEPMAYSTRVLGHRGSGVSIYREALAWDSPAFVPRLIDAFRFRSTVAARFPLDPGQARANARHRQAAADEIAFALARRVRAPSQAAAALAQVARVGPPLWRAIAAALPRLPAIRRAMAAR